MGKHLVPRKQRTRELSVQVEEKVHPKRLTARLVILTIELSTTSTSKHDLILPWMGRKIAVGCFHYP